MHIMRMRQYLHEELWQDMFNKLQKYYYSTLGPEINTQITWNVIFLQYILMTVNCSFSLINLFFKLQKAQAMVTIIIINGSLIDKVSVNI